MTGAAHTETKVSELERIMASKNAFLCPTALFTSRSWLTISIGCSAALWLAGNRPGWAGTTSTSLAVALRDHRALPDLAILAGLRALVQGNLPVLYLPVWQYSQAIDKLWRPSAGR